MSTEIRNWDVVAKAMEAAGATSSQMYIRAKALAEGKLDPMPTSFPEAPYSISAVAGWSFKKEPHRCEALLIKSMNTQQPIHQYLIRYKDLEGKSYEQSLCAFNAMEARHLVMECVSGLGQRPNLIRAILKSD